MKIVKFATVTGDSLDKDERRLTDGLGLVGLGGIFGAE